MLDAEEASAPSCIRRYGSELTRTWSRRSTAVETMQLPENWVPLSPSEATKLEAELRRELGPRHRLHGRSLSAIARRERRDDVLFATAANDAPVFCVHLTWSKEEDPTWPWTEEYRDVSDFLARWGRDEGDSAADDDAD